MYEDKGEYQGECITSALALTLALALVITLILALTLTPDLDTNTYRVSTPVPDFNPNSDRTLDPKNINLAYLP